MNQNQLEVEELKVLTDKGYEFEIEYPLEIKPFLNIGKSKFISKTEKFRIEPLRLSTLDRIAEYQIKLIHDDEAFKDENRFPEEANELIIQNNKNLISIVALAVLGTKYSKKRFENLVKILSKGLTSSMLTEITTQIFTLSDHGNFISSTRLMLARNVIKPNEVE